MCRLVGIVASEVTEFGLVLKEAPRSLARLSREHPDGWGIAAHGVPGTIPPPSERSPHHGVWRVHKGTNPAGECARFLELASHSAGTVLIAHVRQKTVGPTSIENTHPFVRSGWVFAHNGTLKEHGALRAEISRERLSQIQGDTDSEVLFAFLLTRLDAAGLSRVTDCTQAREATTQLLATTTEELRARNVGAFNFLLSDGASCFVHRFGRSLYLLERKREEAVPASFTPRRRAVLVASEHLTEEEWTEVPDGSLFRLDGGAAPAIVWPSQPDRAA